MTRSKRKGQGVMPFPCWENRSMGCDTVNKVGPSECSLSCCCIWRSSGLTRATAWEFTEVSKIVALTRTIHFCHSWMSEHIFHALLWKRLSVDSLCFLPPFLQVDSFEYQEEWFCVLLLLMVRSQAFYAQGHVLESIWQLMVIQQGRDEA